MKDQWLLRVYQYIANVFFLSVLFVVWPMNTYSLTILEYVKSSKNSLVTFKGRLITFYGLNIKAKKPKEFMTSSSIDVIYNGKRLLTDATGGGSISDTEVADDFPAPGMTTLVLKLYDGGASCCWSYEVFTINGNNLYQQNIPIGWSSNDSALADNGLIIVVDHGLVGFGTKDLLIDYCPALHPTPKRFAVFDNMKWRADKVGEFPANYKKLLDSMNNKMVSINSVGERHAAAATQAYYCLMSGESREICYKILTNNMPKSHLAVSGELFNAVCDAVAKYDLNP